MVQEKIRIREKRMEGEISLGENSDDLGDVGNQRRK